MAQREEQPGENPMPVVGYSNRLSVKGGESIDFMVSCDAPTYSARLVRLLSNGLAVGGNGPRRVELDAPLNGEHIGKREAFNKGSYVFVPPRSDHTLSAGFTLQAWVYPTLLGKAQQTIISRLDEPTGHSCGLFLDGTGRLTLRAAGSGSRVATVKGKTPLRRKSWYFVAGACDSSNGRSIIYQHPALDWPGLDGEEHEDGSLGHGARFGSETSPILIGGVQSRVETDSIRGNFNGKIDDPGLFTRALALEELLRLAKGLPVKALESDLAGAWDFSLDVATAKAIDVSGHGRHGRIINYPKRAVTGHNWSGRELDFKRSPREYGAIYFHEDDLEDAKWRADFSFEVPDELRSGIYAVHLQSGGDEDFVPFFVRPAKGKPQSKIAFLLPTLTYLAYSSFHSYSSSDIAGLRSIGTEYPSRPFERYSAINGLTGLYDLHPDGSGVSSVTRLRPILTQRPGFVGAHLSSGKGAPHLLSADLILAEWMESKALEFDIITDEDLHHEGADLLRPYKLVITSSHPEYWTGTMLDATESYLNGGGRLMYLGGNGFYWVTSIDPEKPHIIEVRRWGGTQGWRSDPGEYHHSTTGEMGGTWRNRGRPERRIVGVGFTGEGVDENRPYKRMPDSFDPEVAFVFEGIGRDELIGDFENPVLVRGAAGFEVDRMDYDLGTPPNARLLARSTPFGDSYLHVIDDLNHVETGQTGSVNPLVRADMTLVDYPNGGAVFSVGSISWCGCLLHDGGDNNVSRVTENVIRKFSSD